MKPATDGTGPARRSPGAGSASSTAPALIRPFTIDTPQGDLDELGTRLARTRWTAAAPDEYGVGLVRLRRLVEYWLDGYDWRAWERRLNSYPQFVTEIGGQP